MRRIDGGNRGCDDDGDGASIIKQDHNYMDRGSGVKSNIFGIKEPYNDLKIH